MRNDEIEISCFHFQTGENYLWQFNRFRCLVKCVVKRVESPAGLFRQIEKKLIRSLVLTIESNCMNRNCLTVLNL